MRAWSISFVVIVMSLTAGAARADEAAPPPPAPQAAEPSPSSPPPSGEEVAGARREIGATIEQMTATSRRVRDMLRDARRRGTRQQKTCLDETMSRSDVALRNARELGAEALAAYGRGDTDVARDTRRRVAEWREAQRVAVRDGTACAPAAPKLGTQATTVKVIIDPGIAPAKL
jgi:hypothetical protein